VSAKYLLPCRCGRQIVVEPRQAGRSAPCSCGELLEVPTWHDMAALEPAPPEPAPESPPSNWGLKHRLRFVGVVLVLVALVGGAWLYRARPVSRFDVIDPEQIQRTYQKLPPSQTWDIWEYMKQGLDRRTDQQYADAVLRFRLWQAVVSGAAALGVALIVVGTVGARGQRPGIGD
jgi:hypothetical protein